MLTPRSRRSSGFTLVELMVTVTVLAIMLALAIPPMGDWIRNNRIRTVADSLQNGLRLAQGEALRRSRQVVFSLTNSKSPQSGVAAVANGGNWSINTLPSMTAGESSQFIESGVLTDVGSDVVITSSSASICFNSIGRLVSNTSSAVTTVTGGATCSIASVPTYDITMPGADRPLRVTVALGGQVHMCDPAKTLSASAPDGCPAP